MDKPVASTYNTASQPANIADRALPSFQAAGTPARSLSGAEALRFDPDGPDNIRLSGEPCQNKADCYRSYRLTTVFESPLKEQQRAMNTSRYWSEVVRRPHVMRHTADVPHVSPDGSLTVVVGPLPDTEEDKQYSQQVRTALMGRNEDYRLVLEGKVSDAVLRESQLAGAPLNHVRIYSHANDGMIFERSKSTTSLTKLIEEIRPALASGAVVDIMGCHVANKRDTRELIQVAANRHDVVIRANGELGFASDEKPDGHGYVFSPNLMGEMDYKNTRAVKEYIAEQRLHKLRSSGGPR